MQRAIAKFRSVHYPPSGPAAHESRGRDGNRRRGSCPPPKSLPV